MAFLSKSKAGSHDLPFPASKTFFSCKEGRVSSRDGRSCCVVQFFYYGFIHSAV